MALFTDGAPPSAGGEPRRSRSIGWLLVLLAVAIAGIFAFAPSPYVIEQPGPVYNTLGTATDADGEEVPLIDIPEATTYPTEGTLDLLTVSLVGNPERRPNWGEVALAWLDSSKAVLPMDRVFPQDLTPEQRDARNQAAMLDSQQDAIAAALIEMGYEVPRSVVVKGFFTDSPAEGILEEGDVITAVDGVPVIDIAELREAIQEGAGAPVSATVLRGGQETTVEVTPIENGGAWVVGIGVTMEYELPLDVQIRLDDVGGPSAGMMFSLGIIDMLTPGAMTGGEYIAGTGTIDAAGNVGAIGGVRQKMHGALGAGASWMLAPAGNCDEIVGNIPTGLTVIPVETLDDARGVVELIGESGEAAAFESCPAG